MTTEEELKEKIANAFKTAREEGVIRRFANGISDAEKVMEWVKESGYEIPETWADLAKRARKRPNLIITDD